MSVDGKCCRLPLAAVVLGHHPRPGSASSSWFAFSFSCCPPSVPPPCSYTYDLRHSLLCLSFLWQLLVGGSYTPRASMTLSTFSSTNKTNISPSSSIGDLEQVLHNAYAESLIPSRSQVYINNNEYCRCDSFSQLVVVPSKINSPLPLLPPVFSMNFVTLIRCMRRVNHWCFREKLGLGNLQSW